ncbi:hypothetical protein ACFL7D_04465 [candidate division KSB1 bacterium]
MKKPWEMTEEEFSIPLFKHISGSAPIEDKKFLKMCIKWHDFMIKHLDSKEKKTGIKTEYPLNLHEELIKWAIEKRKKIPDEVMEEYPHLKDHK